MCRTSIYTLLVTRIVFSRGRPFSTENVCGPGNQKFMTKIPVTDHMTLVTFGLRATERGVKYACSECVVVQYLAERDCKQAGDEFYIRIDPGRNPAHSTPNRNGRDVCR